MLFKKKPWRILWTNKNLARIFPNDKQGKQRMNKLWAELAQKLKERGPLKLWRKIFRDQRYIIKKKFGCNKGSKEQTRSGAFVEIPLTFAEEQIIEAAGLEASVMSLVEKSCSTISSIGPTWDIAGKTQGTTLDFDNAIISIRSLLQKNG
uniref:MADF domain-containing protein n=1 Tax=Glossina palpalis gambiensis TaxID=67801 RepID=A0A1B0C5D1_9MUSC